MTRWILWAGLGLTPIALVASWTTDASKTALFVLAAAALVPLAWLIGEATEHAAEHTGPGIGGLLNATFGNAPELIIALLAVARGLPDVVLGSIAGSVVSNLLLVLGLSMIAGSDRPVERRSLLFQLLTILVALTIFLVPAVPSWHGDPWRHALYVVTVPVAAALLVLYVVVTAASVRRHRAIHVAEPSQHAWSLRVALGLLALATLATALVAEVLVHSLDAFARAAGLSEFFIAAVIVAIVGNAAEHGGAVIVARRGNVRLAAEIAISSSTQVAVFVAPAVALLSWLVGPALPLSFRPVEIATMAVAALVVVETVVDGRSSRREGFLLVGAYAIAVAVYYVAGNR